LQPYWFAEYQETTMGRISPALAIQSCPHAAAMAGRRWEKSP